MKNDNMNKHNSIIAEVFSAITQCPRRIDWSARADINIHIIETSDYYFGRMYYPIPCGVIVTKEELMIVDELYNTIIYRSKDMHNTYDMLHRVLGISPNTICSMYGRHMYGRQRQQPVTIFDQPRFTADEHLRSKCTHKFKDGRYSLIPLDHNAPENGDVVCEICGARFNLDTYDKDTLSSAITIVKNAMQQLKTRWPDIPMAITTEFHVAELWLEKMLSIYENHTSVHNRPKPMHPIKQNLYEMCIAGNPFGYYEAAPTQVSCQTQESHCHADDSTKNTKSKSTKNSSAKKCRGLYKKYDKQLIAQAMKLLQEGKPPSEVSKLVGIPKINLYYYLCKIKRK